MKKSRFSETQIIGILNEAEAGMKVMDNYLSSDARNAYKSALSSFA